MDKFVTIKPIDNGRFEVSNNVSDSKFYCHDADAVGAYIETAMWPHLYPALVAGLKIKITVEYIQETNHETNKV